MMSVLEIVRAGAGAGKTTDLCKVVCEAVDSGLDPAKILATTFTRKAAAELKSRIQAKLMKGASGDGGPLRQSERLELAAVGTVHSVSLQILRRYAIEMGLSPLLEVLTEQVGKEVLKELTGMRLRDPQVIDLCHRLGVEDASSRILRLVDLKRGNRIGNTLFKENMTAGASRVCELLAPDGGGENVEVSELMQFAENALRNIEACGDVTKVTETATTKLGQLGSNQIPYWGRFLDAQRIKAGKRLGADAMLDPLRVYSSGVRRAPGLHEDVHRMAQFLAQATISVEGDYGRYKTERGLVDFTDLEILFLQLLENAELREHLSGDYELVLVDEFQDTNPLQLAIFERLREISQRSRWVGDAKQAIYGFRGTDPELVQQVWQREEGKATRLIKNYRSQKGLVELVGCLFTPIFGQDAKQDSDRESLPRGVERWLLTSKNKQNDAKGMARGILKLKSEGIEFGDMAVLERTNLKLDEVANSLDAYGIPYLRESAGLFAMREAAVVLAGLRLLVDRNDSLAAATLIHLLNEQSDSMPSWLTDRLNSVREREALADKSEERVFQVPWKGNVLFSKLEQIDDTGLSPLFIVQQVIEALDLPFRVSAWGDPARRHSNLDSILRHASDYESISFGRGEAISLAALIHYFEQLIEEGGDVKYPPVGYDGISLMTYHSAKGLEWPVVIMSGFDSTRPPDLWSPSVAGGGQQVDPLNGRVIESWNWPFGVTKAAGIEKIRTGSEVEKEALDEPEGIALSELARQESLRLLYVGCTRARDKLVFVHRSGKYPWLKEIPEIDHLLSPDVEEGEHVLEGVETSYVLRRIDPEDESDVSTTQPSVSTSRWIAAGEPVEAIDMVDRRHSPSQAELVADRQVKQVIQLPGSSFYPEGAGEEHYSAIGDAVHSYLAALPSMKAFDESRLEPVAERCLSSFTVEKLLSPADLVAAGRRFQKWVEESFPEARWHVELAVDAERSKGGRWVGNVDLALQLSDGGIVIIDHKSAPIRRNLCESKALQYSGQLEAYREALVSIGDKVGSTWVHFPLAGTLVEVS